MRADARFAVLPKSFWAHVRAVSQELGYTTDGRVRAYKLGEVEGALAKLGLTTRHLHDEVGGATFGATLVEYLAFRATVLNTSVEPLLMDGPAAKAEFERLREQLRPRCPLPKNKQRGEKAGFAALTGIVNMLIEAHSSGHAVDYDPRKLTTFTRDGAPLRTLARRVDGCFPSSVNPVALWEIKEYYHTTTFGSRVADGVYETLLDGLELEELREHERVHCDHLLIVDSHFTWWGSGKSYLCRMVDMLHMGYVDEILFGREVFSRLPTIVEVWTQTLIARERAETAGAVGQILPSGDSR